MRESRFGQEPPTELTLHAAQDYPNPYTDVEVWVDFTSPHGQTLRRPAFWDGGRVWRVRFASPCGTGQWTWESTCSDLSDTGLYGRLGTLEAGHTGTLLQMSPGRRTVVLTDGTPLLLVGDTAWALPWRGTPDTVTAYAEDRRKKGFNCVLLLCVQPDQDATGPRDRHSPGGFDVGFEDLPDGHLNQLNPAYFQFMDMLMDILLHHGLVPIYQPVFHGYGWKGLRTLGTEADPHEYARFCRYLVARYGARPAVWLVGADGDGLAPGVEAGGREIAAWDAYRQPVGIHYNPFDVEHQNRSHQDADWLDFQWCQTGHDGTDTDKVSAMSGHLPVKGVANAEPTYKGIAEPARAAGWWQGHTAWQNLTAGGTMGVFYGAAALWQWKFTADEAGWPDWATDHASWRDALHREGSAFVGLVAQAFAGFDYADMAPHPELAGGRPCTAKPGTFYCVYLPDGGTGTLSRLTEPLPCFWFNPQTGALTRIGSTVGSAYTVSAPDAQPWVLIAGARASSLLTGRMERRGGR